jgi:hypothetical protein
MTKTKTMTQAIRKRGTFMVPSWSQKLIPIGKSEPLSIVRGEPPDLSSILVSPSEALF